MIQPGGTMKGAKRPVVQPGGPMKGAPKPQVNPGGTIKRARQHGGKPPLQPGGPVKGAPKPGLQPGGPARRAKKHKKRGLALDGVACCATEALAASLRLTGWPVTDQDVLALYWLTADDADAGASILATLEAAQEFGLAGRRLADFGIEGTLAAAGVSPVDMRGERQPFSASPFHLRRRAPLGIRDGDLHLVPVGHGLILGVDLPGPHTVTVDPAGQWLTWGEVLPPFPDAVIEEAWAVTW